MYSGFVEDLPLAFRGYPFDQVEDLVPEGACPGLWGSPTWHEHQSCPPATVWCGVGLESFLMVSWLQGLEPSSRRWVRGPSSRSGCGRSEGR